MKIEIFQHFLFTVKNRLKIFNILYSGLIRPMLFNTISYGQAHIREIFSEGENCAISREKNLAKTK